MRLAIAEFKSPTRYRILERKRVPVRLGESVFKTSRIAPATLEAALEAFRDFRDTMKENGVVLHRAVATSATREAKNRSTFLERVHEESGIDLEMIPGTEEARLVAMGVRAKAALRGTTLILDVGGGSSELALVQRGEILLVESHNLGTVRLLEQLGEGGKERAGSLRILRETVRASRFPLLESLKGHSVTQLVGTGGNIEALATLHASESEKDKDDMDRKPLRFPLARLRKHLEELAKLTPEERIKKHNLRPDRADVIVPAGVIIEHVAQRTRVKQVLVPFVGLVDGVLLDLAGTAGRSGKKELESSQTLNAARALMRKYDTDPKHSRHVTELALSLFDQLKSVHELGKRDRLLLEIAGLLHEVGNFISPNGHHRHAYYIISETPILGLTDEELHIVANVARYHRKAPPDQSHECYAELNAKAQDRVRGLAAILRLADALDHDHRQRVLNVSAKRRDSQLTLKARTRGDVTLDEWSVGEKGGDLFFEEFDLKPVLKTHA
ncbi:MAG TPA: Ppx/GppA phosphatase family protein [Candidatus Polarisedimenticolia bacterium]|nr:Ppx/GppA phosphatase family protein [Candidatus Polarisedimenticolia bacterium]